MNNHEFQNVKTPLKYCYNISENDIYRTYPDFKIVKNVKSQNPVLKLVKKLIRVLTAERKICYAARTLAQQRGSSTLWRDRKETASDDGD